MAPPPSICVYCGAHSGTNPAFSDAADATGTLLADQGWRLVYGAGDVGLMGRVARSAQAAGGQTFGVIPVHLMNMEVGKRDLSQFIVTENMHERKKVMFMNSDAIVILPGGPGTMDEFFEVLTWRQLGLHDKPIFILNVAGYWDNLLTLMDGITGQGFADQSLLSYFSVVNDVATLEAAIQKALP